MSSSIFSIVSQTEFLFPHHPLYSQIEIEIFGQLDMIRHPEVGLGLLLVMATVIAPAATADDIALLPLMTADGIHTWTSRQ